MLQHWEEPEVRSVLVITQLLIISTMIKQMQVTPETMNKILSDLVSAIQKIRTGTFAHGVSKDQFIANCSRPLKYVTEQNGYYHKLFGVTKQLLDLTQKVRNTDSVIDYAVSADLSQNKSPSLISATQKSESTSL
jgi:hypothetical protein